MKLHLLFVGLFLMSNAHAADLDGFSTLFAQHYKGSFYKQNKCGENIETLIRVALKQGIDVSGAELIYLENTGSWNFGLIDAHRAREQGPFVDPEVREERKPGQTNWEFHIFLLVEGRVLDFDFDNQPKILPLNQYIPEMFFKYTDGQEVRAKKLKIYKASVYRVKQIKPHLVASAKRSEFLDAPIEMTLNQLLER